MTLFNKNSNQVENLQQNSSILVKSGQNSNLKKEFWIISILCLAAWHTQIGMTILLPINFVVTLIHELSHAIVCILSGGQVSSMTIINDGCGHSGLTFCAGGLPILYAPAGYLGTTFVGCILLYLSQYKKISKILLCFTGVVILIISLAFSGKSLFQPQLFLASIASVIVEIIIGIGFLIAGVRLNEKWANLTLLFLSIQIVLNSVTDLFILFQASTNFSNSTFSDATNMANITHIPAFIWSIIWCLISMILLYFTLKISYLKQNNDTRKIN